FPEPPLLPKRTGYEYTTSESSSSVNRENDHCSRYFWQLINIPDTKSCFV
ncbi:hypothetical protein ILUMI_07585, partial [Ignelater luminosus]